VNAKTLDIIRGTSTKPVASEALIEALHREPRAGQLFVGYPVMASTDGPIFIDALLVSPSMGLICFDLIEGVDTGDLERRQDDAYSALTARLLRHRDLIAERKLSIPISTATFAPAVTEGKLEGEHPLLNRSNIDEYLTKLKWKRANESVYRHALSALQNITTIRRPAGARRNPTDGPRAQRLEALENSIATLDRSQGTAVIETVEGVQRIRGLAGSGKTIVLALKAAYLHARNPDWRIAVTFHTRSLKGFYTRLIHNFVLEQTGEEPDWSQIRVVNSWGAPGNTSRDGIYYEFCRTNGLDYLDFQSARNRFGYDNAFVGAVTAALDEVELSTETYDVILVDEAQDLPPEFLRLCYQFLKPPKRLVYAYDELQNLTNEGLPTAADIFGTDDNGRVRVSFEQESEESAKRDIILGVCYRNPRPILVAAHALGFGIYRDPLDEDTGLVQMFDRSELWADVGYEAVGGTISAGELVRLERNPTTSPLFLENHSKLDDMIRFERFGDESRQAIWVAEQIKVNLVVDGLRHADIMIINTDPITARRRLGRIRARLHDLGIRSHIAGVDTDSDEFRQEESVTCTGIYRAKGNEAAMVYVVNADQSYYATANLARMRNRLFTAITRSTAWLRVSGVGSGMESLMEEYTRVCNEDFALAFGYPTNEQLAQLKVVHRDMSHEEEISRDTGRKAVADLIKNLDEGMLRLEDISSRQRQQLLDLLDEARRTN